MTTDINEWAPMCWSLESDELVAYTANQVRMFSLKHSDTLPKISEHIKEALSRVERCFQRIHRKYFFDGRQVLFNHLNSDHYAIYLYFLSNSIFRKGKDEELASQLFLLNKTLHAADLFYSVNLPEVFLLVHPLGTVLGNASYGDYLVAYQNCTVGSTADGRYPRVRR